MQLHEPAIFLGSEVAQTQDQCDGQDLKREEHEGLISDPKMPQLNKNGSKDQRADGRKRKE